VFGSDSRLSRLCFSARTQSVAFPNFADLIDDCGIDSTIELVGAVLLVDPDLRQLVAQLHIPTQLTPIGEVTDQVAARRGWHVIGPGTAHAWHSSQGTDRSLPRLVEIASRIRTVLFSDFDTATRPADLDVPAQASTKSVMARSTMCLP
jgi:hypothetical protein